MADKSFSERVHDVTAGTDSQEVVVRCQDCRVEASGYGWQLLQFADVHKTCRLHIQPVAFKGRKVVEG